MLQNTVINVNSMAQKSGLDKDLTKFRKLHKQSQPISLKSSSSQKMIIKGFGDIYKKNSSGVRTLTVNGKTGVSPTDKAEMLNDQFTSIFTKDQPYATPQLKLLYSLKYHRSSQRIKVYIPS